MSAREILKAMGVFGVDSMCDSEVKYWALYYRIEC